jgi:hypothetical protein
MANYLTIKYRNIYQMGRQREAEKKKSPTVGVKYRTVLE